MPEFTIQAPSGAPTLDIRFGGDYSELYLGDQPLALTWSINDGSIMDHLIRFAHPAGHALLQRWRDALEDSSDEAAILKLASATLASGSYRTLVTDIYHVDACLSECSTDMAHPTAFYGGCYTLVTTLPRAELSEERISYYEQLIRSGKRPLAVALCCFDPTLQHTTTAFLIDGHHKAAAYQRCRLYCHVLMIARCHSPLPNLPYPAAFAPCRLLN